MTNLPTRILITDDDPLALSAAVRALMAAGYEALSATNGEQTLQMVEEYHPDLMLLDVVLPDIEGTEICRRIKADARLADIFVILLSGIRTGSEEQAQGMEDGADGYIARPIANRELLARVQAYLRIKTAEQSLKKYSEQLEDRVAERTAELTASNKELEAFVYSVAHDLRSPLRGIDGWSLALQEEYGHLLDAPGHRYIERVRFEAQRMGELIDALLRLSRVTRTPLSRANVNLSEIAQRIAARLQAEQPDRKIEFKIRSECSAYGDASLLEIVLSHLLDNAVKFTGTRLLAHIEFGQNLLDNQPTFFVRDNGAGFNMDYVDKLFSAFQRLHTAAEFPGEGIGLATAQRIILRHGGQLWAEAKIDQGATFYFTFTSAA